MGKQESYDTLKTENRNAWYIIKQLTESLARVKKNPCAWRQDDDGLWNSDCEHVFCLDDGSGPIDNHMRYCCYCGGKMVEEFFEEEDNNAQETG